MKVCLLTGANRGLGLEFVRQLSREEYRVLAGCRNPDHAGELQTLIPEEDIFKLDVRKEYLIETMAQEIRSRDLQLDLLVNNAGIGGENQDLENLIHEDVLKVFYTNAVGPLLMVKIFLPLMKHGSVIVNVSSRMGSIADNSSGGYYGYRMSKAALNMATVNLHRALSHRSIAVVAVHPGWVRTRMGTPAAPLDPTESVSGLLKILRRPRSEISGKFIDYQGTEIPW